MAETVILTEIDIDIDAAVSATAEMKANVEELTRAMKESKAATGATSEETIRYEAQLRAAKKELREQQKLIDNVTISNDENAGSIRRLQAQTATLRAEQRDLNLETEEGIARNEEINTQINANTDAINANSDAQTIGRNSVGQYTAGILEAVRVLREQEKEQRNNLIMLEQMGDAANMSEADQERHTEALEANRLALQQTNDELHAYGQNLDVTNDEIIDVTDSTEAATGANNNMGSSVSELSPALGQGVQMINMVGKAFKLMLGPIGWVIAAIGALITWFKSSEEGQNAFAKVMAVLGTVMGNLADAAAAVGKALWNALTAPQKALDSLKAKFDAFKEFFGNTFGMVIVGSLQKIGGQFSKFFDYIGLGWQKVKDIFTDNADGILEAEKNISESQARIDAANVKIAKGVENTRDAIVGAYDDIKNAVTDFISENEREINIAIMLANKRAKLDKRERDSLVETAKERLDLERLKNKLDDKTNSTATERLEITKQYNSLLDTQQERLLSIAKASLYLKEEENKLSSSTKEDLLEEAQLRANVYQVQTEIEGRRREAIAKRIEAEREIATESITLLEREIEAWKMSNDAKLKNSQEYNESLKTQELEVLQSRFESNLILEQEYLTAKSELNAEYDEIESERKKAVELENIENKKEIAEGGLFAELDIKKEALQRELDLEIEFAEKIGADVELIKKNYAKKEKQIDAEKFSAGADLAAGFAGDIATIFGESAKIGKAAAVTATTINTIQGAIAAFASMAEIGIVGVPLGIAAASAAIATGGRAVQKILAVPTDPKSASSSKPSLSFSSPSTSVSSQAQGVQTDIGVGIVSRNQGVADNIQTNTLVVDSVTDAQLSEANKTSVSTL